MSRAIEYEGLGALSVKRAPRITRAIRPKQPPRLTERDCQLLDLLAKGLILKEAGPPMFNTEGTAKVRLFELRRKFNMRTTLQLMAWYARLPEAR